MDKLELDDLDVRGRRVVVRVDFNVPLRKDGQGVLQVADGTRVQAALPTIKAIIRRRGKAVLLSHLGRPKGRSVRELSLAPVAAYLRSLLEAPVRFVRSTAGPKAWQAVRAMAEGSVALLENTRFHAGETSNDPAFAASLAALGDLFVNDAFGTAHRAHASNVGIVPMMQAAAAGYLLKRELQQLARITQSPARPVVALVGGAKVSSKIGVLTNLVPSVDAVLVGGAMSYTFLKALGQPIGRSMVEKDRLVDAARILERAGGRLRLPGDHVTSTAFCDAEHRAIHVGTVPRDRMGLDIGPQTIEAYRAVILKARTVVWNGPMGVFEHPAFAEGTRAMAQALVDATRRGAATVIGGGDSIAAIKQAGLADGITHVCTGGGAMLDFLEGRTLPAVAALTDKR